MVEILRLYSNSFKLYKGVLRLILHPVYMPHNGSKNYDVWPKLYLLISHIF